MSRPDVDARVYGEERRRPWAQRERNPWVRGKESLPASHPVREGGPLCAEFPALPGEN